MNKKFLVLGGLVLIAVIAIVALKFGGADISGTYVKQGTAEGLETTLTVRPDGTFIWEIKSMIRRPFSDEMVEFSDKLEGTYKIKRKDYVVFYGASGGIMFAAEIQPDKLIYRGNGGTWVKK